MLIIPKKKKKPMGHMLKNRVLENGKPDRRNQSITQSKNTSVVLT